MRRNLAPVNAVVVALLCLLTAACSSGGGDKAGATASTAEATTIVPGKRQAFVTGSVRRFSADNAQISGPLATPFTISALDRGSGTATIENALVDGKRSTISWPSGTPLPISGTGGIDLGAVHVEVDSVGTTWHLDGPARAFVPGTYRANAPVAVGAVGIATSRDSVEFTADSITTITTSGGVVVHVDPARVQLEGPGSLTIAGQLQVQTSESKRAASTVTFKDGPFTATLTPAGGQVRLDGVLQGPVTSS